MSAQNAEKGITSRTLPATFRSVEDQVILTLGCSMKVVNRDQSSIIKTIILEDPVSHIFLNDGIFQLFCIIHRRVVQCIVFDPAFKSIQCRSSNQTRRDGKVSQVDNFMGW